MSFLSVLLLFPLFAAIMIAIKLDDGGPVFFVQERVGLDGKKFRILKFRSMVTGASDMADGHYINGQNDGRITLVGRLLRKSSLDELPQLINILKGEMSLVGPRPGMPFHMAEYTPRQMKRLQVKPGLTGWAQVNGRNSLSWPERIELDLWYIEHRSMLLNAKVILRTIPAILRPEGLYASKEKFCFNTDEKSGITV